MQTEKERKAALMWGLPPGRVWLESVRTAKPAGNLAQTDAVFHTCQEVELYNSGFPSRLTSVAPRSLTTTELE
jgi:hypothetical protein